MDGVGERIKHYRMILGLTQRQLGERVGISVNTMANYELNRREPTFQTFLRLAQVLKVTPNDLLGVKKPPFDVCKDILESAGFEVRERRGDLVEVITPSEVITPTNLHAKLQSRRLVTFDKEGISTFLSIALQVNADHYERLIVCLENALSYAGSAPVDGSDRQGAEPTTNE